MSRYVKYDVIKRPKSSSSASHSGSFFLFVFLFFPIASASCALFLSLFFSYFPLYHYLHNTILLLFLFLFPFSPSCSHLQLLLLLLPLVLFFPHPMHEITRSGCGWFGWIGWIGWVGWEVLSDELQNRLSSFYLAKKKTRDEYKTSLWRTMTSYQPPLLFSSWVRRSLWMIVFRYCSDYYHSHLHLYQKVRN